MSATVAPVASGPPRTSWAASRWWVLAALAVVALFLALGLLAEAFAPAPAGPTGSTFATAPDGAAAWAQLLAREGYPVVQLRRPLTSTPLPPQATLVVLDATSLSPEAAANLDRFARSGGRLVIAGGDLQATLPALLGDAPDFTTSGPVTAHPISAQPEVAGVTTVRTAGAGAFTSPGEGRVALAGPGGALLVLVNSGSRRIALLADASPVENSLLATADNAQLALDLAGPRKTPVIFAEALHGYGEATGLAAIPGRWWVAFAGLLLAAAVWALARGRRLGPPEDPPAEPAPPRSAYVDALAGVIVRTRDIPGAK
jgi:Domain of unknown function (DUF4350)